MRFGCLGMIISLLIFMIGMATDITFFIVVGMFSAPFSYGLGILVASKIKEKKEKKLREKKELERQKFREEQELQRKRRRTLEAFTLIKNYPEASKYYFKQHWGIQKDVISVQDVTSDKIDVILSHRNDFEKDEQTYNPAYRARIEAEKREKERREAEQKEAIRQAELAKQRAREQRIQNLPNKVASWNKFHSLPYYFFYYYYPTRFTDVSSESQKARRLIWNFKDGMSINPPVYKLVGDKLKQTFTSDELKELTFIGIPASTRQTHKDRYEDFCKRLCEYTGMRNAYPHVTIEKEKTPKHLSPTHESEPAVYEFNRSFFQDARVIIFDDVVTQGNSLLAMKLRMERVLGATVIAAISLGRTYSDYRGDNRQPHPYSEIL